jgi:hypothetical protein
MARGAGWAGGGRADDDGVAPPSRDTENTSSLSAPRARAPACTHLLRQRGCAGVARLFLGLLGLRLGRVLLLHPCAHAPKGAGGKGGNEGKRCAPLSLALKREGACLSLCFRAGARALGRCCGGLLVARSERALSVLCGFVRACAEEREARAALCRWRRRRRRRRARGQDPTRRFCPRALAFPRPPPIKPVAPRRKE